MNKKSNSDMKGKVKYNVSSKIDSGIRKEDDIYSNCMSPQPLSTAYNSRPITSNDINQGLSNQNTSNNNSNYALNKSLSKQGQILNSSMNRSFSSQRTKSIKQFQRVLNDPNQSNIKTLENVIFEVKNNCFEKVKSEVDERTKVKHAIEKNIDLIKDKIKLSRGEGKFSFKQTHNLVLSTKHYQALENRMNHEMMINDDLEDIKVEVSKLKFEYENRLENNRNLRNEILLEEKNMNLAKEEFQRTNKALSSCNREKDNLKISINQLKKHIKLMNDKLESIDEKNKNIMTKIYQLSQSS